MIYRDGKAIDLDGRERGISSASGINSAGSVVGFMLYQSEYYGTVIEPGGRVQRLDELLVDDQKGLWRINSAVSINDGGQSIGNGLRDGDTQAYYRALRLTPVAAD